jgi:hypothetical protein
MPVAYEIDQARGLIRTRCIGNVTLEEVLGHFPTLAQDPGCPARLDVLLDLSEMTAMPEPYQLREISDEIGRVSDRVRFGACAIVAPSNVLYGLLRMFEVFAEKQFRTTRVFREIGEAESWLLAQLSPAT